jgi:hypothetical protein
MAHWGTGRAGVGIAEVYLQINLEPHIHFSKSTDAAIISD